MSRITFAVVLCFAPSAAFAHVGHVGELAGHDHWIAIAASGLAAAVWAAGKLKDNAKDSDAEEPVEEADAAGAEV